MHDAVSTWQLRNTLGGGLFKFAKTMVSVLCKELECKVEKLNFKKLEVMQPRIKNTSDIPTHE